MSGDKKRRVVYGSGPVSELLSRAPGRISELWVAGDGALAERARGLGVSVSVVDKREIGRRAGADVVHQGVVAALAPFEYADLDDLIAEGRPALVVLLDGITDPHNLGAILRSVYLLGADGAVIPENRSASINAVVTKTSAGASELVSVARVGNLARAADRLKERGLWLVALVGGESSQPLWQVDLTGSTGLVLGSEGHGIRRGVAERCDFRAALPMHRGGVGSFNVSVAAGLALYEVARQRNAPK